MVHRMDHTFTLMLGPQCDFDFNEDGDARTQIQNRGGPGWLRLVKHDEHRLLTI